MRLCTIDGCSNEHFALGMCQKHYTRKRRHDKSYIPMKDRSNKLDFNINKSGCFVVTSHKATSNGYPSVYYERESVSMHRKVYTEMFGDIPKGYVVRHKCDNKKCVNPEHLEVGTYKQNSQDMVDRNRHSYGEKNKMSKLRESDVIAIRENKKGLSNRDLTNLYNVSESTIIRAKTGKSWKHV